MLIKFVKGYSPYQSGEIAGFKPEKAKALIKMKAAVEYRKTEPVNSRLTNIEPEIQTIEPVTTNLEAPPANRMVKKAKKK